MSLLSTLFGRGSAVQIDARRVYNSLLKQSRAPEFYTDAGFEDNYDGRVDVLTLHMAALIHTLNRFEQQGGRLSQAVFDEMKDDFEVALREEGLSDGGVKKRIKPIVAHFYTRVKIYTDVLMGASHEDVDLSAAGLRYLSELRDVMGDKTLGQIAMTDFDYPNLTEISR